MFIAPVAAIIPAAATSSALIYVGILMLANLRIYRTRHWSGSDQLYSNQTFYRQGKRYILADLCFDGHLPDQVFYSCIKNKAPDKGAFSLLLCLRRQAFMDDGQDRFVKPGLEIIE